MRRPFANSLSLAVLVAAVALRWLLDPLLASRPPLITLFGAVAVAVWVDGYRPALVVAVLGFLASEYLFVPPYFGFAFSSASLAAFAAYLLTCSIIIIFGETLRRAQRRASEGQERLRVALTSIGDAVITTDPDGRITYLNAVAESVTGWKQEKARGQPLDAVFRIVNEQTREPAPNPVTKVLREGVIA